MFSFNQDWKCDYKNHQIAVHNSFGVSELIKLAGAAKRVLYIDGKKVDESTGYIERGETPILRGQILIEDEPHVVEVYLKSGLFKVSAKICVDDDVIFASNE